MVTKLSASAKRLAVSRFFFAAVILLLHLSAISAAKAQLFYVSNGASNTIDKVNSSGAVSTYISSGLADPTGLAFDTSGNLYEADGNTGSIIKITPSGVETTFATGFNAPRGLAFDSNGNLYEEDYGNGNGLYIKEISPTGVKSTFATGLDGPYGEAFDSSGNLFVSQANSTSDGIIKITPGGVESTFYSGNSYGYFTGIAFDTSGNLYASTDSGSILNFTSGGVKSVFATGLTTPRGLTFDSNGNLYVANYGANDIIEITPGGVESTFVASISDPVFIDFQATPEPSTWALLIFGGAFLLFIAWQQKRKVVRVTRTVL